MKRSKSKSTTSLSNLPTEQCQHVLSFLTCSELLTLTLVSKAVKSIALKSHTLVAMDEDEGLLTSTRGSSAMLRKTILNGANLEPLTSHPRQRRWTVNGNADNNISQRMSFSSSGHYHCMTEQNMINLLQRFKSLRVLKLSNFKQTTMESIIQIINTCPAASSLVHIEFHGVRLVQNKYSLQLPYHNRNLKHFILSGTIFCNYEDVLKSIVVSENLQTLYLDGCRSITDLNLKDMTTEQVLLNNDNGKIKQKPMLALKYLTLKNASKLIKPTIQCPSLIELNLSQCHILRDLSNIICPNLIDINLSQCSMVNDESIHSLLLSCPMIEVLLLSGCNSLNALNITSKRIRHIDMNLCIGLVTANIHCQAMEKLELGFCRQLENLRLDLKELKKLDLSLLETLKDLFLHAPKMQELNLSGCFDLRNDSTFLTCPNLRTIDISASNLGQAFEKEYIQTGNKKISVLKGGTANDWMTNF